MYIKSLHLSKNFTMLLKPFTIRIIYVSSPPKKELQFRSQNFEILHDAFLSLSLCAAISFHLALRVRTTRATPGQLL